MMNLSELLTSIKMDLGIYGLALPIDDLDEKMYDVIKLRSVKTFSQFFPYVMKLDLDLNELKYSTNNYDKREYTLPDVFGDRKIMYIRNFDQRPNGITGYSAADMGGYDLYESFMMGQATANLASAVAPATTFEFVAPNRFRLYNTYMFNSKITLEVATEHFSNLASIPNTSWESFYEIALIDVKQYLYGILKHYNEIQTAHGTINLRIDDWADAAGARRELVEKWRNSYHLDLPGVFFI